MVPVKRQIEKRYSAFRKYIKQFAEKDIQTNDEDYNMGQYEVLHNPRFCLLDPLVNYYITCNNLRISDI